MLDKTMMAGDIWKLGVSLTARGRFALVIVVWIIIQVSGDSQVDGYQHQCRTGWCSYKEYCCGPDFCCDYLTGYWYIWMVTGILIFSVILACCWSWSSDFYSPKTSHDKYSYVPAVVIGPQGEEYHIHQQPSVKPLVYGTTGEYIATEYRGQIVPMTSLQEMSEINQGSSHYPPPYSNTEQRNSPSAPPLH